MEPKVFELWSDWTAKDREPFGLSETTEPRQPRSDALTYYWSVRSHGTFDASKRMTPETRAALSKLWMLVTGAPDRALDLFGMIGVSEGPELAVSTALAEAMTEKAADALEFLPVPRIWSRQQKAEITWPKFHYMHVVARIDSWDASRMKVVQRRDPRSNVPLDSYSVQGSRRVVKGSALAGATIWRDAKSLHTLCTEDIKGVFEAFAHPALNFRPVEVSAD